MSDLEAPPALLSCLLNHELPTGPCSRAEVNVEHGSISDFWYTVPLRAAIPCTEDERSHALSAAGSNQMDPSKYLHLGDCEVDIRPSKIVMYCQHSSTCHTTTVLCIDFQDGRWCDLAAEPFRRTRDSLKSAQALKRPDCWDTSHLVVLTSAVNWWRAALRAFSNQLIAHVCFVDLPFLTLNVLFTFK
jgi:hypothetical protein